MELLAIILSGITSLFSLTGLVADKSIEAAFRAQIDRAERLEVRTDNAPPHQIINGKINKLRLAGRGVWVSRDLRVDMLDVETDPIDANFRDLQNDGQTPRASSLKRPAQAGVRFKVREEDINNYLKSPDALARLQKMTTSTLGGVASSLNKNYQIANPQVRFIGNNRVALKADLQDATSGEKLPVSLETGVSVVNGRTFQLLEPSATVGTTPVPQFLIGGLTSELTERLSVDILEQRGITARILQFKVDPQELDIAAFVRITGTKQ